MRVDRWFNVLVLGGAALVGACKDGPEDVGVREAGEGGTSGASAGSAGDSSSAGAGLSSNASGGGAGSGAAGSGGAAEAGTSPLGGGGMDGGSGGNSGSAPVGAGASSGGVGGSAGSAGSSAGGSAGSGTQLACHIDAAGHGDPKDPCGCPCCWATDCPNTDATCCVVFCKSGDEGRGCCGK